MNIIARRSELLADTTLVGRARRAALTDITDEWIKELATTAGINTIDADLIAVGSYGRRELAPGSDIDLVLVVGDGVDAQKVSEIADKLWYPIWDSTIKLDHSIRTVAQAKSMAVADLKVVLGLLDARLVVGSGELAARLKSEVLADWRSMGGRRLPQLHESVIERERHFGELAYLIEPDLKESVGGLRDLTILRAISATWLADIDWGLVEQANQLLLDARDALHVVSGRSSDRVLQQEQAAVAEYLGFDNRDDLLRALYGAGRTISYISDLAWNRVKRPASGASRRRFGGLGPKRSHPDRTPLAQGVVLYEGQAVLAKDADPSRDPLLLLRAAAAAAQNGVRLSPNAVYRLAHESAPLPTPWPRQARESLVSLIGAGRNAIPVWEALDQFDVWSRLIPEWSQVRSAPQHNPVHIYTVDRHLVEAAVRASALTRRVARPDLLLVGALLHDIGKARGGDHTEIGIDLVQRIAPHLGFDEADTRVLSDLVKFHLLLPELATRRDPRDPATVALVTDAVKSHEFLDMLHALTESDARATGPAVATDWRFSLISDLVGIAHSSLRGDNIPEAPRLSIDVPEDHNIHVTLDAQSTLPTLTVVAPDRQRLLAITAGVLALHRLGVRTATTQTIGNRAASVWGVTPQFGEVPDVALLAQDLRLALEGSLDVREKLQRRRQDASSPVMLAPEPLVLIDNEASAQATVIEVRAHDVPGLLHDIAQTISDVGLEIVGARVATLGSEAVDAFYVLDDGQALSEARFPDIREKILAVLQPIG